MKKWYSLEPALSRGANLTFVIGRRSAGKTYSAKDWAFKDWLKNKKEWVFVRRGSDEINAAKKTLWNDYLPQKGYETKTVGFMCKIRPVFIEEEYTDEKGKTRKTQPEPWEDFGYFVALTDQQVFKGSSYPKVNKIIFDEFIIENKRRQYIPNEVDELLSLIYTVARDRKVKTVCLSNAGYISNPYFQYYNVRSTDFHNTKWVKRNEENGRLGVLFEFWTPSDDFESGDDLINSISNSRYADYALHSKFLDSSKDLVDDKPYGAQPYIKVTSDGESWFTIYTSNNSDSWWIDSRNSSVQGFSLNENIVNSEAIFSQQVLKSVKTAVHYRKIFFATSDVRAVFLAMINMV